MKRMKLTFKSDITVYKIFQINRSSFGVYRLRLGGGRLDFDSYEAARIYAEKQVSIDNGGAV